MHLLELLIDSLPKNSLFRSGEPYYMIALPFLFAIPETMLTLHLAWRSIGRRIPVRNSIWVSVGLGLGACLIRQLLSPPFHILPNLIILIACVMATGHVKALNAILGGVFAVSVTMMGSFLIIEPLFAMFPTVANLFTGNSLGYTFMSVVETIIPVLILLLFVKFNLTPIARNDYDHAKKTL